MAIKCRKTQIANNPNVGPRFNFKTYESANAPFHNNDTDIDFVTYNGSLYVCVNNNTRYVAGDPATNGFLLLVAKGTDGRQGVDGAQGPIGPMPELWMRFNGKQLEVGDQTARKAISPDLTGPSWFPELRDKKIVWVRKENGDNSVPSTIDLEALRPLEERPLLLRLDSDNTRRSDEESGPGYYIQWKREGSDHWTNLMSISELMNLALAGCCIWSVTNPDTEKTEYHFGHRQVLRATYDASRLDGGRIAEVELGDVLFDAGAINLPDFEGQIDTLHDMICALDAQIPTLDKAHIVSALGYTPLKEEDIDLSKVKLRIDPDKTLYISYNGDNGQWVQVGRTCECSPEQSSRIPEFEVFTVTNGNVVRYTNNDYKVSISGDNVTGVYDYGQWPQLVVGEYYNFTVYLPQNLNFVGSPTGAKRFTGEPIQLFANKAVTKYTVTITKSPANAVVKVNGVTYSSPIQVSAGDVINVKATASGYEDWNNSYTINSNQTIPIQMDEKESAETSTSCVVTIRTITPSNGVVYYGQQQVHIGDTFTVPKGSSMHFTGPKISGYNALDKDYRVYYSDTQDLDIEFDAIEIPSTVGYHNVTINCNVTDATVFINGLYGGKDPIIANNTIYETYSLENIPQIIKVKDGATIIVSGIKEGYNSDEISKTIIADTTINLQLTSKSSAVDYSDHRIIFTSAKDEDGNLILAPITVIYSEFHQLGTQTGDLQDILNRQDAGEYIHVGADPALTVIAFAEGYEPFLQESFEMNSDGDYVITPVLESNNGDFFWIAPLDHLLDNHSTYLQWEETSTNQYTCVPVIRSAGYYRVPILCASSDSISVTYTGDITRTNATTRAYYNESFDRYDSFDHYGILFVTGYVSQAGNFATVEISSNGETKTVNFSTNVTPTPNRINFNIPNDISGLNIVAKINNETVTIPMTQEIWVANNTTLNVVATSNNYHEINTGDVVINDHYTLIWTKNTEPSIVANPTSLNYTASGGDKIVSVSTFNFEGTPTISAEVTNHASMFVTNGITISGNAVSISVNPNSGTQRTGTVRITATYQSTSAYVDISIIQDANENPTIHVTNIEVSPKHIGDETEGDNPFDVGSTYQLVATITPSNASDKRLNWVSNDTSVATVDSNGLVTAVGAGTTSIRVSSRDNSAFNDVCSVTVAETASYDLTIYSNTPNGESYTVYADGGATQLRRFEVGTEIEIFTTSNNYTATISPSWQFTLESDMVVNIYWTSKETSPTYHTITYSEDPNGDQGPDSYDVLMQGVPFDSGDSFMAGAEITLSVDFEDDYYDAPEIYVDGALYDGEFILNNDAVCLIKWFRKKEVTISTNADSVTVNGVVGYTNGDTFKAYEDDVVPWSASGSGLVSDSGDYTVESPYVLQITLSSSTPTPGETYCARVDINAGLLDDVDFSTKLATTDGNWSNVEESNTLCNLSNGDTVYLHLEADGFMPINKSYTIDITDEAWDGDYYQCEVVDTDCVLVNPTLNVSGNRTLNWNETTGSFNVTANVTWDYDVTDSEWISANRVGNAVNYEVDGINNSHSELHGEIEVYCTNSKYPNLSTTVQVTQLAKPYDVTISNPDGYTVSYAGENSSASSITDIVYPGQPYSILATKIGYEDFYWQTYAANSDINVTITSNPSSEPAQADITIHEVTEDAEANPGNITYDYSVDTGNSYGNYGTIPVYLKFGGGSISDRVLETSISLERTNRTPEETTDPVSTYPPSNYVGAYLDANCTTTSTTITYQGDTVTVTITG